MLLQLRRKLWLKQVLLQFRLRLKLAQAAVAQVVAAAQTAVAIQTTRDAHRTCVIATQAGAAQAAAQSPVVAQGTSADGVAQMAL